MDSKKILLCEDEESIREFIVINLNRTGYAVTAVGSGEEALSVYDENDGGEYVVAILDITLPGIDGFEVCKELRKRNDIMGIIMLSARSQEMDKVRGLLIGADDYITKPFSPSELTARVDVIFRRAKIMLSKKEPAKNTDEISSGPFTLNAKGRTLMKNDSYIDLTQVEFQIIEKLMMTPNILTKREDIISYVWGDDFYGDEKILDVNIRRIRKKIENDPSNPQYIKTVWGKGYLWSNEENIFF